MRANIGGDDLPRGVVSLADDMAAYDALPAALRTRLSSMAVNWNAVGVRDIAAGYGTHMALAVLEKTEMDMQARFRDRLSL